MSEKPTQQDDCPICDGSGKVYETRDKERKFVDCPVCVGLAELSKQAQELDMGY